MATRTGLRTAEKDHPAIKPLSQEDKIFHLLFGWPDSGKTSYIAELAKTGKKVLIIRTPLDHFPARALKIPTLQQWVVNNWHELDDSKDYIRHLPEGQWDWVCLDSISLTQDWMLQSIWDDLIVEKPHRAKYRVDQGEYGVNMWRLEQWIRHTVGANTVNLCITAHPFMKENPFDEEGGEILMPWIQGKAMPEKICGMMNFVGYLEVKEDKEGKPFRRLHTHLTSYSYGKDQFDAFENGRLDHPTLTKVEAAIEAAKQKSDKVTPLRKSTTQTRRGRAAVRGRAAGRRRE